MLMNGVRTFIDQSCPKVTEVAGCTMMPPNKDTGVIVEPNPPNPMPGILKKRKIPLLNVGGVENKR